jgi:hypothetical protein
VVQQFARWECVMTCLQEDCANWDGDGCPCRILDLEPVDVRAGNDFEDDEPCDCTVPHPRWCAWNGACCDDCTHDTTYGARYADRITTPPAGGESDG